MDHGDPFVHFDPVLGEENLIYVVHCQLALILVRDECRMFLERPPKKLVQAEIQRKT